MAKILKGLKMQASATIILFNYDLQGTSFLYNSKYLTMIMNITVTAPGQLCLAMFK